MENSNVNKRIELVANEHKHSHPSGRLTRNKANTMMTDRMMKLCELMGIPLIDHLIVGGSNKEYFSFKEKDLITNAGIRLATDYRSLDYQSVLVAEKGKGR